MDKIVSRKKVRLGFVSSFLIGNRREFTRSDTRFHKKYCTLASRPKLDSEMVKRIGAQTLSVAICQTMAANHGQKGITYEGKK